MTRFITNGLKALKMKLSFVIVVSKYLHIPFRSIIAIGLKSMILMIVKTIILKLIIITE